MTQQRKNLRKYILPAMIGNLSFFVLTIVDGMFVGNGVGPDALGAVSLAMPFVNLIWALSTLFNIGGVAVASVRLGRGDTEGANLAFMHALSANLSVFSVISVTGMLLHEKIAQLLGANETYLKMVSDYVFWYSVFLIPSTLGPCLNTFARNDGNPRIGLTSVIASYLFSTKRTQYAIAINVCRSITFNFACINFLPLIFGYEFIWYTVTVSEGICMGIAMVLRRISERNGIIYR